MDAGAVKHELKQVVENDFTLKDGQDYFAFFEKYQYLIGHPDPELRDGLLYPVLFHFIVKNRITSEEVQRMMDVLTDEFHLFYKVGTKGDDSVLTRSFSALLLAPVFYRLIQDDVMSSELADRAADTLQNYILQEEDFRAVINGKGWAHASAHCADALHELLLAPRLLLQKKKLLASGILRLLTVSAPYGHGEPDRLARAAAVLGESDYILIERLLESLFEFAQQLGTEIIEIRRKVNTNAFLYALFYRLSKAQNCEVLTKKIRSFLG
ncbi:MAG: DUF2785 domain-containing protein [Spirochaetia bacterium]